MEPARVRRRDQSSLPIGISMHNTRSLALLLALAAAATPLAAQQRASSDSDDVESQQHPPRLAAGLTAGALDRGAGESNQSLVAIVQLQPRPWLSLSVAPGVERTTYMGSVLTRGGGSKSASATGNGLTDIPVSVGASHGFEPLPWSPGVAAELTQTLAAGSSTSGTGVGHGTTSVYASLDATPVERLSLSVGEWRPLSSGSGNGALDVEGALSLGRATATLGMSNELGTPDSGTVLARSIAGGIAYALAGPLTLTVDAGHGLTTGAPRWSLEVGLGTAFAGISPISATSPLRRMKKSFGAAAASGSGYSKKPR